MSAADLALRGARLAVLWKTASELPPSEAAVRLTELADELTTELLGELESVGLRRDAEAEPDQALATVRRLKAVRR